MKTLPSPYGEIGILYEDNHLLAAVKPPNLPSQGDKSGDADMLSLLKEYLVKSKNKPGDAYMGLVHRLDRPVGGVMVFAKTSKAAGRLSEQFRLHTAKKQYLAVLEGELNEVRTLENTLLDKQGQNVRIVPEGTSGAKTARLTTYPLAVKDYLTLVRVELDTGRKHQIRVQHAHIGVPLYGDMRYGHGRRGETVALWAFRLTLTHPTLKKEMTFSCPPPNMGVWEKFTKEINAQIDNED
ncbi:MAG: RluA family pseudouridine synthase [Clostridiales bacterium]|nr:RluA family pseudouridine synthase [Clostridiales bacterium]